MEPSVTTIYRINVSTGMITGAQRSMELTPWYRIFLVIITSKYRPSGLKACQPVDEANQIRADFDGQNFIGDIVRKPDGQMYRRLLTLSLPSYT